MRQQINCCEDFLFINNGSPCRQRLTKTNFLAHSSWFPLFLSSLFIIMLTLRVSLGRRQRSSLLFHKGRQISAKSVCATLFTLHHSCIVCLPGIWKSRISGICWKCGKSVSEAFSPGVSFPELRENPKAKLSKDGEGDRKTARAPEGYKAVLILRENAWPSRAWFLLVVMCHWRQSEASSWLSPLRKHVSLLERP